ncbi:MFS transporter [Reinekea sp.]|uniref:MFS transporter n=1 Tax=Reinekea sp. TaxID=1970455 RepID=UPI003989CE1F
MIRGYIDVLRAYWPMLIFGLLTVFFGNFGQSFFISWFAAPIQAELALSSSSYGLAYSVATLCSGLIIMVVGGSIDKVPLSLFVSVISLGLFSASLVMWQMDSVVSLVIALFMLRFFGQGLLPHTAMTSMGRYFSASRGRSISVAGSGVPIGEMLLPSLLVLVIALVGWQNSWLIVALSIICIYLPVTHWLLHKAGPSEVDQLGIVTKQQAHNVPDGSRRTVLRDKRFWLALPLILAPGFIVTGIFVQQPYFLSEKGWSTALFATSFVIYGGVHWLTSLVTGTLVDRYSAASLLIFLGAPLFLGLATAATFNGVWVVFVMMAMLAGGIGMAGTITNALWAEVYGTTHLGSIRSLNTALGVMSTAASPFLLGIMIDAGVSVSAILWSMAVFVLVSLVLARQSFRV